MDTRVLGWLPDEFIEESFDYGEDITISELQKIIEEEVLRFVEESVGGLQDWQKTSQSKAKKTNLKRAAIGAGVGGAIAGAVLLKKKIQEWKKKKRDAGASEQKKLDAQIKRAEARLKKK